MSFYVVVDNGKVVDSAPSFAAADVKRGKRGSGQVFKSEVWKQMLAGEIEGAAAAPSRQQAAHDHLKAQGLSGGDGLWFPAGTDLIDAGKANYAASFGDWDRLQPAEDVLLQLAERIEKEDRRDAVCDARSLRMNDRGQISRDGQKWVDLNEEAFSQICTKLSIERDGERAFHYAAPYLWNQDADHRADGFNRNAAKFRRMWEPTKRTKTPAVKLRLRRAPTPSGWEVFALVGGKYPSLDADRVLREAVKELDLTGYRASGFYNPKTTEINVDAFMHAPQNFDPKVGDVFRGGVKISTNDAGRGSLQVFLNALRVRCVNLTTLEMGRNFRQVHKGRVALLVNTLRDGLAAVEPAFGTFREQWGLMSSAPVNAVKLFGATYATVEEALSGAVAAGHIGKGVSDKVLVEMLLKGHAYETEARGKAPDDLTALVNAVTWASHQDAFSQVQQIALSRQAGELVPILAKAAAEA